MLHEVDDAAAVLIRNRLQMIDAFVGEHDLEALVEEGHGLQALEHGASHERGALGLEDAGIGPKRNRCAGLAAACGRIAHDGHLVLRTTALGIELLVMVAIAVDFNNELLAQGVDHADTHAVQTARHLVALATKFTAGVQHGEHNFGRALALVRARWIWVNRNTTAVVVDAATAIGQQGDVDAGAITSHGFVDGVVDNFPDQVMQASKTGGADVHAGALADGIEALKNLNVLSAVVGGWLAGRLASAGGVSHRHRRPRLS